MDAISEKVVISLAKGEYTTSDVAEWFAENGQDMAKDCVALRAELAAVTEIREQQAVELAHLYAELYPMRAELAAARAELQQARKEIATLYTAIHDMDNARLEVRRDLEAVITKTGNAYKYGPPESEERPPTCLHCGAPVVWCTCEPTPPADDTRQEQEG